MAAVAGREIVKRELGCPGALLRLMSCFDALAAVHIDLPEPQ